MIAGVFVGGASRRMGGKPKGLLPVPAGAYGSRTTVIERTIALARAQCDEVVLVGNAEAYGSLRIRAIEDDPVAPGEGPLAGLVGLLGHAQGRSVIALACDMPYITSAMLARLATHPTDASAVAPRHDGAWSPLFARYDSLRVTDVARAILASGGRALYAVLDACGACELPLGDDDRALLRDWDSPADIERGAS